MVVQTHLSPVYLSRPSPTCQALKRLIVFPSPTANTSAHGWTRDEDYRDVYAHSLHGTDPFVFRFRVMWRTRPCRNEQLSMKRIRNDAFVKQSVNHTNDQSSSSSSDGCRTDGCYPTSYIRERGGKRRGCEVKSTSGALKATTERKWLHQVRPHSLTSDKRRCCSPCTLQLCRRSSSSFSFYNSSRVASSVPHFRSSSSTCYALAHVPILSTGWIRIWDMKNGLTNNSW